MNTTHTINVNKGDEAAEMARKLAVNHLTGASVHVPSEAPAIPIWDMSPQKAKPAAAREK